MAQPDPNRQFFADKGEVIRVNLPDGRKAIVTEEARTLPVAFHRAASREGAYMSDGPTPEQSKGVAVPTGTDPLTRGPLIEAAINEAIDAEEDDPAFADAFTRAGIPSVPWLSTKVGFTVTASERDVAWNGIQKELEAAEAAETEKNAKSTG